MKKRLLVLLLTVISCVALAFGLAACKTPVEQSQWGGTTNPPSDEEKGKVCFVVDGEVYEEVFTEGQEIVSLPKVPTKNNYVFEGWYWDDKTFQQPFAANSLRETELSATINVYAKWTVDLPYLFESQTYIYDGTEKSLLAYNMSSGITVTYSQNNQLTEVGSVQVTATFYDEGVALGSKTATLTITPATPNVTVYNQQKLTVDSEVELKVTGNVEGIATLNVGQQLRVGRADYSWTFVPNDNKNYKTVMGIVQLDVEATVTFKNEDKLFGTQTVVQNGVTHSPSALPEKEDEEGYRFAFSHWSTKKGGEAFSFDTPIKDNITLYAVYESEPICYSVTYLNTKQAENNNVASYLVTDGTIELAPISAEHYVFDGWYNEHNQRVTEIMHGSYGDVTLTAKWTAKTYTISYRPEGGTLTDDTELKYTVENAPMDIIVVPTKENYRFAGWYENQDGEGTNITRIDLASVRDYVLYAKWTPYVDINSVGFTDKTYEYDGSRKSLTAANIPEGVSVEYTKNYLTDVGSLSVTATFYIDGEIAGEKTATLRIIKATYDMSEIVFVNKTFDYDGTAKSIAINGELPEGVKVFYENNNKIEAGRYTVTANFEYDTFNYNEIESLTATLTINKIHYNLSNLTFSGARYTYDGQAKSVTVLGVLPSDVTVSYTGNEKINAGTYTVVAHFESSNSNYYAIDDWAVSLIIEKADYNMNFVRFQNKTFTYDGNAKSLSVTGDIPSGVSVTYMNNAKIDAGSYIITAKFAGDTSNYNLIPDMTATLTINKAVPDVTATCDQILNLRSTVELTAQTDVDGTIVFDGGQNLILGRNKYSWTYTPINTDNYEIVHGTVELNVCATVFYINDRMEVLQQNVTVNNSAVVPEFEPKRQDSKGLRFTFVHWSLQEDGVEYDFTSPVEEDTKLYAVYSSAEIEYAITYYDTYGAANTNQTKYTVSSQFSLVDLSRDYYTFGGWYDETGAAQSQVLAGTWGNLSLFAKWTPIEYHIEYVSQHKAENDNPATYNVESSFAFLPAVFDTPYVFEGWYADESYTQEVTQITLGQHVDITLFAKWAFTGTYISTLEELQNVAYNMGGSYELTTDLTITSEDNFEKIGDSVNPFTGYFNGGGHYIDVGQLFGIINGTVKNINVTGQLALANFTQGSIYNCHSSNNYLLYENQGFVDLCSGGNGLVVKNCTTGVIRNSYSTGGYVYFYNETYEQLEVNDFYGGENRKYAHKQYIGGLVAENSGVIETCYVRADINTAESIRYSYTNTYSTGWYASPNKNSWTWFYIGGVVGYSNGTINQCYFMGKLTVKVKFKLVWEPTRPDSDDKLFTGISVNIGGICGYGGAKNCFVKAEINYETFSEINGSGGGPYGDLGPFLYRSGGCYGHAIGNAQKDDGCFSEVTWGEEAGEFDAQYNYPDTNSANFRSRDFILNNLQWGEYIDEDHVADGNVWVLANGQYPKLWFET